MQPDRPQAANSPKAKSARALRAWKSKRRIGLTPLILPEAGSDANAPRKGSLEAVPEGARYIVSADIVLKGAAKALGPFLRGHIRRQIIRYVLESMRYAAEAPSPAA